MRHDRWCVCLLKGVYTMKMIAVTNERGNVLTPTYPKCAKYLIKHGRAKANGADAIILLAPPKNIDINKHETHFVEYLIEQKRTQNSIDNFMGEFESFCAVQPNPEEIGKFAWRKGSVTGVKPTYSFLEAFADFCEARKDEYLKLLLYGDTIRIHIRDHFEGEAWQAVTNYKNTMMFIPEDTQIDTQYLGGLTNEEYIKAFGDLQRLIYAFYEAIENGSPFEWGWADWSRLTVYGINHNRVIRTIHILSDSDLVDDKLVVEKKLFLLTMITSHR